MATCSYQMSKLIEKVTRFFLSRRVFIITLNLSALSFQWSEHDSSVVMTKCIESQKHNENWPLTWHICVGPKSSPPNRMAGYPALGWCRSLLGPISIWRSVCRPPRRRRWRRECVSCRCSKRRSTVCAFLWPFHGFRAPSPTCVVVRLRSRCWKQAIGTKRSKVIAR